MNVLETNGWDNYELLDSGDGKRLERFGTFVLVRPDPQCIWQPQLPLSEWENADAVFTKGKNGKEEWIRKTEVPHKWIIKYNDISFYAKLSPFKHTGVFPEQHLQWEWISEIISKYQFSISNNKDDSAKVQRPKTNDQINVLNLFGYTGIASLVAAQAGAKVTHVDASYPTIGWARENQELSHLSDKPIRWIMDDCMKYMKREVKRGVRYDGIIMDPPVFGHGPEGERWEFFESFPVLLDLTRQVLSENPLFVMINAYAISASALMLENILHDMLNAYEGKTEVGELALKEKHSGRLLSTGIYGRWSAV
jgi:23S rRNA (cytosine1962-C5)-methyltransferase